jgi:hypothetical protein
MVGINVILTILHDDRRIRIRIRMAKKHVDPVDPDPDSEHWKVPLNESFFCCRKKEFVFRLRTSDQAEFLFQTSDEQELRAWVDTVNTVVAR